MKVMTLAVTAALCASSLFAADIEQLKGLPRGVQNIKYENGVISTMVVVGHASVPKAIRKNPGKAAQYAGSKAQDDAQLQFTRFMSTKCKWGKTADGETAVKEEAASTSSTDAQGNETSQAAESSSFTETEMTKEQKAQSAQACVSAIQSLWEGMNDNGEFVWVGAWNAKALASLKNMSKMMNEVNAEVDDTGKFAKKKRDAENKKELEVIEGQSGNGQSGNGEVAQPPKKTGDPDILNGMKKPKGTVSKDADGFL